MRRFWIVLMVLTAAVVMAVPAGAAKPSAAKQMDITIALSGIGVSGTADYSAPTDLTFFASGMAADSGLICVDAVEIVREDLSNSRKLQLYVKFDCTDGSGDFNIKLQGRHPGEGSVVSWLIYGGRNGTGKGTVAGEGYVLTGKIKSGK